MSLVGGIRPYDTFSYFEPHCRAKRETNLWMIMSHISANCGITYAVHFEHPERCRAFTGRARPSDMPKSPIKRKEKSAVLRTIKEVAGQYSTDDINFPNSAKENGGVSFGIIKHRLLLVERFAYASALPR